MTQQATFLHVTDAHISGDGISFERDDHKLAVPGLPRTTRETAIRDLFSRLAEKLAAERRTLDGVFFSGDAQDRGAPGGHELLFQLIMENLEAVGITPAKIVATPGNHDVPRDTLPGSVQRYADFTRVWRDAGCVVPWLDGIDAWPLNGATDQHSLVAEDCSWAIYPVNTSNWSHVTSLLPKPLSEVWDSIPIALAPDDDARASKLRDQLQKLTRYDMARVSEHQLEALRSIIRTTPAPTLGRQLKMVMMHHHLRSPTLREELKPFADISNLEQVRALLRASSIDIAIHGHKHEHAVNYDHIYAGSDEEAHRMLVVSGATFEVGRELDAMRLITISGLPHTPEVTIEPLPLPRAGIDWQPSPPVVRRLWIQVGKPSDPITLTPDSPVVIQGSDIDEVYARACAAATSDVSRGTLVIHLDLDPETRLQLPSGYPLSEPLDTDEKERWLNELVTWWQMDRSHLEHRIPYLHGSRLRRYGGNIDQVRRVIKLLGQKPSTRAIAVIIDPFRDFKSNLEDEEFASFCLVEFRRRDHDDGTTVVDSIAFYRAQEITRWWPINIAELRLLQCEICDELHFKPGRITTVAADARTIARSPTQVAMPIIDRWLDQAPEKLHLLANVIVNCSVTGDAQHDAVLGWRHALKELLVSAEEFNRDGIPIAIEGLRRLAMYVSVGADNEDGGAKRFTLCLNSLADHNETYEQSKQERGDFNRWSPTAKTHVGELTSLTDERLG